MVLTTFLFCEDVRPEMRGTYSIIGQFSGLTGDLGEKFSFKCFVGVKGYFGVAKLLILVKSPDGSVLKKFLTDPIACTNVRAQSVASFEIKDFILKQYGDYSVEVQHNNIPLGEFKLSYSVRDVKADHIKIKGKDIKVPRVNLADKQELTEVSRCFLRRFTPMNRPIRSVKFISQYQPFDGIGSVSRYLVEKMVENGIKVDPKTLYPDPDSVGFIDSIDERSLAHKGTDVTILNALPAHMRLTGWDRRVLLFTYWENDTVNEAWVNVSNTADAVFTPSEYVKEVYVKCGLKKPVYVYDQPIDDIFCTQDEVKAKVEEDVFTILFIGTCIPRKGIDVFCEAFDRVFGNDVNVKARIHMKPWSSSLDDFSTQVKTKYSSHERVFISHEHVPTAAIRMLMDDADLLVAPSRSEGLGLIPIQALATGTPVIIPNHSGFKQYSDTPGVLALEDFKKTKGSGIYASGNWYESSVDELSDKLLWAKENIAELKEKARRGSSIIRGRYNANITFKNLMKQINKVYNTEG